MNRDLIAEYALENDDPRLQFLDEVHEALKEIDSEVCFWWDVDPSWSMEIHGLCVSFEIVYSDDYGDDDEGYNAGWVACRHGGEIVANFYPYNYTSRVWTKDMDELRDRIDWALETLGCFKEDCKEGT